MSPKPDPSPRDFCLPDLGEGLEEAELVQWEVQVGQEVKENDIVAKMETAKALVDVPSPRDGVIAALHAKPGQAVKVGSPLVSFEGPAQEENAPRMVEQTAAPVAAESEGNGRRAAQAPARRDAGTVVGMLGDATNPAAEGQVLAAPAVRRLARDLGVDIATVHGTGIGGRITSRDVEAIAGGAVRPKREAAHPPPPNGADSTRIPFRGVRRAIAEHLRHSVTHAIHFTVMDEADVTALDALRRKLVAASNEKISLLPFVASAVCRVLTRKQGTQFGRLNSTVDDDAQEIVQHLPVHLGIATDTESGLMVPVIRDAEQLGVLEISRRIAHLAKSARERSLSPNQLTGSTFTISNFGSLAGRFGTPIINYPEAAILAVGRAREGVVVRDGMLGVGKLLPLSLAADHRVVDGASAAAALAKIIELLQSPDELLPPGGS